MNANTAGGVGPEENAVGILEVAMDTVVLSLQHVDN
jgi:hypothetical protein